MRYQQQVNLYTSELKPQRVWFRLEHLLAAVVLAVVLMVGLFFWFAQEQKQLNAQRTVLEEQRDAYQQQIEELTALAEREIKPRLQREQERLAREQQYLERLIKVAELGLDQQTAASEYLTALARQTPEGLWFDDIEIQHRGAQIRLSGKLTDSTLLPILLDGLGQESVFARRAIEKVGLTRIDEPEGAARLRFSLRSERPPEPIVRTLSAPPESAQ